jgi:AcrR family transcriptional regulator
VSQGSIFKHFKTKAILFIKAMNSDSTGPAWAESLMAAAGQGDIRTTLEAAGGKLLEHLQVVLPRVMMIRSSGVLLQGACHRSEGVPRPIRHARELARYFRAEIKLGRLAMSAPDTHAHAFVGALSHYVFCETLFNYRPAAPQAYVRTVVDAVVKAAEIPGMGGPGRRGRRKGRRSFAT